MQGNVGQLGQVGAKGEEGENGIEGSLVRNTPGEGRLWYVILIHRGGGMNVKHW